MKHCICASLLLLCLSSVSEAQCYVGGTGYFRSIPYYRSVVSRTNCNHRCYRGISPNMRRRQEREKRKRTKAAAKTPFDNIRRPTEKENVVEKYLPEIWWEIHTTEDRSELEKLEQEAKDQYPELRKRLSNREWTELRIQVSRISK